MSLMHRHVAISIVAHKLKKKFTKLLGAKDHGDLSVSIFTSGYPLIVSTN